MGNATPAKGTANAAEWHRSSWSRASADVAPPVQPIRDQPLLDVIVEAHSEARFPRIMAKHPPLSIPQTAWWSKVHMENSGTYTPCELWGVKPLTEL